MKTGVAVLRWFAILGLAAAGMGIVFAPFARSSASTGAETWVGLVIVPVLMGLAAIPLAMSYFAYRTCWREFFAVLVPLCAFASWFLMALLLVKIGGLVGLFGNGMGIDRGDVFNAGLLISVPVALRILKQLSRVLDFYFPPTVPVKGWIKRAV